MSVQNTPNEPEPYPAELDNRPEPAPDGPTWHELAELPEPSPQDVDPAPRRYTIYKASDALAPQPPVDWIVEKLFSAGSVNLVVGEAGSKKTWSMIDLCIAVANGETWLDFPTVAAPVLIVDEESGQRRLSRRLGQALRGHYAGDTTPLNYVSLAAFDLGSLDDVNELQALIVETGARFVLIDALADVMPGRDENAVQYVQPIFIQLRKVAEATQAALVIIHHSNKAGGYRGSTAMKGAVDLMLMVESKSDSPNIDFKIEKARDTEPFNFAAIANFSPDNGPFNLSPSIHVEKSPLTGAQDFVIGYLAANPGAEIDALKANAEPTCAPGTALNALRSLASEKMGYVKRIDNGPAGGRGNKACYDLTQKGKDYAENRL